MLLLAPALLLWPVWLFDRVLVPADILKTVLPWQAAGVAVNNPALSDLIYFFTPWKIWWHRTLRAGEPWLWNPLIFCGHPFVGSLQTSCFDVFRWLTFPFGAIKALGFEAMLRLGCAGVGAYAWARSTGLKRTAGLITGLCFGLTPWLVVWLGWPHAQVAVWLPWLLWATEKLCVLGRRWGSPALALFVGLQYLGGHIETSVHLMAVAFFYGVWRLWSLRRKPEGKERTILWLGALAVGHLLACIQLLPFVHYFAQSFAPYQRTWAVEQIYSGNPWVIPVRVLFTFLLPNLFGRPDAAGGAYWLGGLNYNECMLFVGLVPLVLAFVGIRMSWARSMTRGCFCIALLSGLVAFGAPPLFGIVTRLPGFDLAFNNRFTLVCALALAWLAGAGAQAWTEAYHLKRLRWVYMLVGIFITGALVAAFLYLPRLESHPGQTLILLDLFHLGFWLGLLLGILAGVRRSWHSTALVIVVLAELLFFGRGYNTVVPAGEVYPRTPGIDYLTQNRQWGRFAAFGGVLPANTGMVYDLADVSGHDALLQLEYAEFLGQIDPAVLSPLVNGLHVRLQECRDLRWLEAAGCRYLVFPKGVRPSEFVRGPQDRIAALKWVYSEEIEIYEDYFAAPDAWVTDTAYLAPDIEEVLKRMKDPSLNPIETPLLVEPLPGVTEPHDPQDRRIMPLAWELSEPGLLRAKVSFETAGILCTCTGWSGGWKALIDGVPAPVWRANLAFLAVPIPAGEHSLELRYAPWSWSAGWILSVIGLILLLLMTVYALRCGEK